MIAGADLLGALEVLELPPFEGARDLVGLERFHLARGLEEDPHGGIRRRRVAARRALPERIVPVVVLLGRRVLVFQGPVPRHARVEILVDALARGLRERQLGDGVDDLRLLRQPELLHLLGACHLVGGPRRDEDDVGLRRRDLRQERQEVARAERRPRHARPLRADLLGHERIRALEHLRPRVVVGEHVPLLAHLLLGDEVRRRRGRLVRREVVAELVLAHLALDGQEILTEEADDHVVLAADLGHRDALEADDGADEERRLLHLDQLGGLALGHLGLELRVADDGLDLPAHDAAVGVDVLDGDLGGGEHLLGFQRHRPRHGDDDAEL